MIKLIASDVDGTLIGFDQGISEANIKAIKKANEQGIHFTIASGRGYFDIIPLLENTGLSCQIIAGNGSEYYDEDGKLIATCYLDKESCIKICKIFDKHGLRYFIHTSKDTVSTYSLEEVATAFVKRKFAGSKGDFDTAYREVLANYKPFLHFVQVDDLDQYFTEDISIIKIEGIDEFPDKIQEVKPLVAKFKEISHLSSFPNNIEITNVNAQKGKILLKACDKMGIDASEVMVIGDGENDLSMFELFPNSAVVENGVDMIKSLAKYHVASVDDDGVAEAIEKYALK